MNCFLRKKAGSWYLSEANTPLALKTMTRPRPSSKRAEIIKIWSYSGGAAAGVLSSMV
jgi:hypothetical protein